MDDVERKLWGLVKAEQEARQAAEAERAEAEQRELFANQINAELQARLEAAEAQNERWRRLVEASGDEQQTAEARVERLVAALAQMEQVVARRLAMDEHPWNCACEGHAALQAARQALAEEPT